MRVCVRVVVRLMGCVCVCRFDRWCGRVCGRLCMRVWLCGMPPVCLAVSVVVCVLCD